MKLRTISVTGMVSAIFVLATCVSTPLTKLAIEELAGTKWYNNEIPSSSGVDRAEITTDGIIKQYSSAISEAAWAGKFTVTESWHDKKGDLWFKNTWEDVGTGEKAFMLNKVSKSGAVWEFCYSGASYPAELSPLEGDYFLYYRQ